MPLVIGYALQSEIRDVKFPNFRLNEDEAKKYGLKKMRAGDKLYATYIPMSSYKNMNSSQWDNTYVVDDRNIEEQLKLGF